MSWLRENSVKIFTTRKNGKPLKRNMAKKKPIKNNLRQKARVKLIINDVIADIAFEKVLTRTKDFDVLATMNLNGDYLSDALAAQVGGVVSPRAQI